MAFSDSSDATEMFELLAGAQPTGDYAYRLPGPNRITIPPPHINHLTGTLRKFDLNGKVLPQEDVDVGFLNGIEYNQLFEGSIVNSATWAYKMRREFTEILPFLYLGPMSAAREPNKLRESGITMLLAIQHRSKFPSTMARGPMRAAEELGLDRSVIEVRDNSELMAAFPHAARIINQHLWTVHQQVPDRMPKVLVFCESGNDRSAAVITAYLMQMFDGVDLISACQIVNLRRFSANVEEDMKQYLLSYEGILQAKRDAQAALSNAFQNGSCSHLLGGGNAGSARKRQRSVDEDEDVEMEEDVERFCGRDSAPFVDSQ